MRRDSNEFDRSLPALLVTYGNTTKKHRYLDCDVIVLGRAASCDFTLLSPEVAPVHCVLVRVKEGWKVRDCSGRPGTRVNGKPVQDTLLDDGDVIQVGAFTFQAHLPAAPRRDEAAPAPPPERLERLERSRRRLVQRALALRKALAKRTRVDETTFARLAAERIEVEKQTDTLRARQREFELRMKRLELSERDLATDRATLEKEYRTLQEEMERHAVAGRLFREEAKRQEQELVARRISVQDELRQGSQEQPQQAVPSASPVVEPAMLTERERQLDGRARELEYYARYLRRLHGELESAADPTDLVDELRELLTKAKKAERRERKGRRETKTEKGETQVSMEDTGR